MATLLKSGRMSRERCEGFPSHPLYKGAPKAALQDPRFYAVLALCDAIRGGRTRERNLAIELLGKEINGPDPNLPLLEDAVRKLAPFMDEIVFVGGVTLGLLITDKAAAPIRGTNDVDVIAEIVTYADYIAFSERLRVADFKEDEGEKPLTCRWHNGALVL